MVFNYKIKDLIKRNQKKVHILKKHKQIGKTNKNYQLKITIRKKKKEKHYEIN